MKEHSEQLHTSKSDNLDEVSRFPETPSLPKWFRSTWEDLRTWYLWDTTPTPFRFFTKGEEGNMA